MISKKSLITIGCTAAVAVIALGAVFVFGGNGEDKTPSSSSADVLEPVTEAPTEPELPIIENFSDEPGLTGLAKMLLRENDDVVGYIKISNTYVDYPVVQYDGEDLDEQGNDYYLHRDLYGDYLESGTIFMDYRDNFVQTLPVESTISCSIPSCGMQMPYKHSKIIRCILPTGSAARQADESKQTDNVVLYGHNMLNGSKFATLHYYRQDESFFMMKIL